ncbi:tissue factor-like [Genypterus blacodes]|uniref:tissue factor-like n=1 Tax=Genypterus blacodes TaxID=154954 RepID=UPI003F775E69
MEDTAALRTAAYVGLCLLTWITAAAASQAQNVRWVSLDFKTLLTWESSPSYPYTVLYTWEQYNWKATPHCAEIWHSECDMSQVLKPLDRLYSVDIRTDLSSVTESDYDPDDPPHTYAPDFNPYKQSEISAVSFSLGPAGGGGAIINITDPLTAIHEGTRQLSIREVLLNDLQYKISYYKAGSTGKRDVFVNSSDAVVTQLDAGESYCFMVAAYIPSRAKAFRLGAWSEQQCMGGRGPELSVGAVICGFLLILLVVVGVVVTVLCCRRHRRQRNTTLQQSAPM